MATYEKDPSVIAGWLRCSCWTRMAVPVMVVLGYVATFGLTKGEEKMTDDTPKIDANALKTMLQSFDKVEQQKHPWGWIRWLMNSKLDPNSKMTFGVVQVDAGQRNPLHMHPNCEEVLYILSGSCEHRIGEETVVLKPGDLLRIPTGVPHAAKVVGTEPLQAVIVYSSGDRQFVLVEE